MTIGQMIEQVDTLRPNAWAEAVKRKWLSDCEQMIINEVILTHEGNESDRERAALFDGYNMLTSEDTLLIIQSPHDDVYRWYLEMQVALANNEHDAFTDAVTMYNQCYQTLRAQYNEMYMPVANARRFKI